MILTIRYTLLNASGTWSSHGRFLNGKGPRQVWVSRSVCFVHKPEVGGRTQGVQSMPKGSPGRTAVGRETACQNWAFLKIKDKINMPDHKLRHVVVKGAQTRPWTGTDPPIIRDAQKEGLESSRTHLTCTHHLQGHESWINEDESQGRTPRFPPSRVCQTPR